MKKSIKAALISALVFPGAGHLYLRRYVPGILLILIAAAATYFLMSGVVNEAFNVADKLVNNDTSLDVAHITQLVQQQSQRSSQSMNIATITIFIVWIIGIVDSYRVGFAQARDAASKEKKTR